MKRILDKDTLKYLGKVILITLLIVFVLRSFVFESFTISTSQMQSTLMKGDEVLVSKLSYGPRLPITLLSVPFTFSYYSDAIELPYRRLFAAKISPNDVVLFNSPIDSGKPLDKCELLISRCVGVSGDTVVIEDGIYYINNKQYVESPTLMNEYVAPSKHIEEINKWIQKLNLDFQSKYLSNDSLHFTMNRYNAYILNKYTSDSTFFIKGNPVKESVLFIVPSKGQGVILSPQNIKTYRQIMEDEQGNAITFRDDEVFINHQKIDTYHFQDDYYWFLSDNTVNAVDSRSLGFIPFKNVVGRATVVLYSKSDKSAQGSRFLLSIS